MQYQKGMDGLKCTLSTDLVLREEKFGGWKWRCGCGLETLRIDSDVIRTELGDRWHQIRAFHQYAEQWDSQLSSSKDFVDYQKKIAMLRSKRRSIQEDFGLLGGVDTSFSMKCSKCGRTSRFDVRVESPLELISELDLVDCFEKLGFDLNNDETRVILERAARDWNFNGRDEMMNHLETLRFDREEIKNFLNDLSEVTKKYESMQSKLGKGLVQSVAESIEEIRREVLKENDEELGRILSSIAEQCGAVSVA